jgi:hypothetical protein
MDCFVASLLAMTMRGRVKPSRHLFGFPNFSLAVSWDINGLRPKKIGNRVSWFPLAPHDKIVPKNSRSPLRQSTQRDEFEPKKPKRREKISTERFRARLHSGFHCGFSRKKQSNEAIHHPLLLFPFAREWHGTFADQKVRGANEADHPIVCVAERIIASMQSMRC